MLTYDDFSIDQTLPLGPHLVTKQEIITFAREFDPQPFHLDEDSEQAQLVGGLIASGWHISSLLMRMMCDSYLLNTASQGSAGLEEIRWLQPVRPDDTLSGTATVLDKRLSKSNPQHGFLTFLYELNNQRSEPVMRVKGMGIVNVEKSQ